MAGFGSYIKDSYEELVHKVTWPTMKELQSSAFLVFLASLLISIVISIMDIIFGVQANMGFWKGILGFIYDLLS